MNKILFYIGLAISFVIAIYLRFDAYLINNSFFTDEVLLAENIFSKSYWGLFLPLTHYQSAPVIFLLATKFLTSFAGISELCFRFIPFVSSLLSVYLFYLLIKNIFKSRWVQTFGLFLFGISYQLLFYTQTFKQYSSDVLITILILYLAIKIKNKNLSKTQLFLLGGSFSALFLASFPALFAIAAFYLTNLIYRNKRILFSAILPIITLGIYYILNAKYVGASNYLLDYWKNGFDIFHLNIYKINFDFLFIYFKYPIILLILMFSGLIYLFKHNRYLFINLFAILIFVFLAAYMKIYPFERRLILFLIPIFIIICIYPLDKLKKDIFSGIILILSAIFYLTGIWNFSSNFVTGKISYLRQDVKPLLKILKNIPENEHKIYLYYGAIRTYVYYHKFLDIPDKNIIIANYPYTEKLSSEFLIRDITSLPKGHYSLLLIKGTATYDKDLKTLQEWLTKNGITNESIILKSASLIKITK